MKIALILWITEMVFELPRNHKPHFKNNCLSTFFLLLSDQIRWTKKQQRAEVFSLGYKIKAVPLPKMIKQGKE